MGGVAFARATPADDADIRRLLRENPLGGGYSLSLEREPDAFRAPFAHDFVLARETATHHAIGLYERVVWPAFVRGKVERVPYLGALRVAASHRNRIAILRAGYASLRTEFAAAGDYPVALTSITADNSAAVRILTAGLRGLPIYTPLAPFSTFVMRPGGRGAVGVRRAGNADIPALAAFLQAENARFDFAVCWTEELLRGLSALGLPIENFLLAGDATRLTGCIALWDNGNHKQSVVRGYPPLIAGLRPLINASGGLFGWPHLPPVGDAIHQVMLSHLAVANDDPGVFASLVDAALAEAARRGFKAAILGLASDRGLAAVMRVRRRAIEYRTVLYSVYWPDAADIAASFKDSVPNPDIGLL